MKCHVQIYCTIDTVTTINGCLQELILFDDNKALYKNNHTHIHVHTNSKVR